MNRYGLTRENLVAALPVALRKDPSTAALAKSVAALLSQRPAEIENVCIYPHIERLDAEMLDLLAYDFKVDCWDANDSLEEKRHTLRSSWRVHKMLGTKYAVETALGAVFPGTRVEEWFEYGGAPHYFRIYTRQDDNTELIASESAAKLLRALEQVKRLSSWLDEIILEISVPPFIESPGHLVFKRFIVTSAFLNYRGGNRFNGTTSFDGGILFDQDGVGIRFEQFIVTALFSHIKGGVGFDGTADFDSSILFNQEYGSTALSSMRISASMPKPKMQCAIPRLRNAAAFAHSNALAFPHLITSTSAEYPGTVALASVHIGTSMPKPKLQCSVPRFHNAVTAAHHKTFAFPRIVANTSARHSNALHGNITIDNMFSFDGDATFDGTRRFAYIKKEEL